jgi:hypothetical protein
MVNNVRIMLLLSNNWHAQVTGFEINSIRLILIEIIRWYLRLTFLIYAI